MTKNECIELLPWYVNGTLSDDELNNVQQWIDKDEAIDLEVKSLQIIYKNIQEDTEDFSSSDLSWRRLHKKIQQEKTERTQEKHFSWSKIGAIAAMMVLAVQLVFVGNDFTSNDETGVELLSGQPVVLLEGQMIIQVKIKTTASWGEVEALLSEVEGEIVQGPSAIGLIRVRVNEEALSQQSEVMTKDELIQWFADKSLIEHAALESEYE